MGKKDKGEKKAAAAPAEGLPSSEFMIKPETATPKLDTSKCVRAPAWMDVYVYACVCMCVVWFDVCCWRFLGPSHRHSMSPPSIPPMPAAPTHTHTPGGLCC